MQCCFCPSKRLTMIHITSFSSNLAFRSITMIGGPVGEMPSKCFCFEYFAFAPVVSDLLPFSPSQAQHLGNLLRVPVGPPSCDCPEMVLMSFVASFACHAFQGALDAWPRSLHVTHHGSSDFAFVCSSEVSSSRESELPPFSITAC